MQPPQSRGTRLEGKRGRGSQARAQEQDDAGTDTEEEIKLEKSNIILLGPTGCGELWDLKEGAEVTGGRYITLCHMSTS